MHREQLLDLVHRQQELESDILKIRDRFKNVKVGQLLKQLTKLSMSKDGISAEGLGLPKDIVDKLEEYVEISNTLRQALRHILGDKPPQQTEPEKATDDVHK